MNGNNLYSVRFSPEECVAKNKIWKVLCEDFIQKYISPGDTVVDLGAGYCEFINNIHCNRRIAIDTDPEIQKFADPGVQVVITASTNLQQIADGSVNVTFASNFFEHLKDKDEFLKTLLEVRRILVTCGKLLVLQPNIRFTGNKYWDFFDHHIPITDRTLIEALGMVDLQVLEVRPRFLPFTTKSSFPKSPLLVRIYLKLPLVQRFFGEQTWMVARKTR